MMVNRLKNKLNEQTTSKNNIENRNIPNILFFLS